MHKALVIKRRNQLMKESIIELLKEIETGIEQKDLQKIKQAYKALA